MSHPKKISLDHKTTTQCLLKVSVRTMKPDNEFGAQTHTQPVSYWVCKFCLIYNLHVITIGVEFSHNSQFDFAENKDQCLRQYCSNAWSTAHRRHFCWSTCVTYLNLPWTVCKIPDCVEMDFGFGKSLNNSKHVCNFNCSFKNPFMYRLTKNYNDSVYQLFPTL